MKNTNRIQKLFPLHWSISIIVPVVVLAVLFLLTFAQIYEDGRIGLYDTFLRTRKVPVENQRIVIVDIDDPSIEELGEWPWKRTLFARYAAELTRYTPAAIGIDINYSLESSHTLPEFLLQAVLEYQPEVPTDIAALTSLSEDPYFGNMLRAMDRTVLPITLKNPDPEKEWWENPEIVPVSPSLEYVPEQTGFSNLYIDRDGIVRRGYLVVSPGREGENVPSYALSILEEGLDDFSYSKSGNALEITWTDSSGAGQTRRLPLDSHGRVLINWPRKEYLESFQHIPFHVLFERMGLMADLWYNISLLISEGLVTSESTGVEAYLLHERAGSLRMRAFITGDSSLLQESYRISSAAEELLEAFLYGQAEDLIIQSLAATEDPAADASPAVFPEDVSFLFEASRMLWTDIMEIDSVLSDILKDSLIVVSFSATSTTDLGANPFDSEYINAGYYAAVMNMILEDDSFGSAPRWINWVIAGVFTFGAAFLLRKKRAFLGIAVAAGAAVVFTALAWLVFRTADVYLDISLVLQALGFTSVVLILLEYIGTESEKSWIHNAFGHYISEEFINELVKDPEKLKLGGQEQEVTILFSDLKNFTGIAENLKPADLVSVLNAYLGAMSDIVLEYGGTIDKYEGDSIMAFFGAPINHTDHRARAVQAAIAMREQEKEVNHRLSSQYPIPYRLFTRIGLNSGKAVVGNLGTERRMNYTAWGHEVNIASRLEGANKTLGTQIILSESARRDIPKNVVTRRLGRLVLVGAQGPVPAYEVLGYRGELSPVTIEAAELFSDAVLQWGEGNAKEALNLFHAVLKRIPNDETTKFYIRYLRERSETEDVTDIMTLTTK